MDFWKCLMAINEINEMEQPRYDRSLMMEGLTLHY